MLNPYEARVDERHFLNLPGFHGGAYVHAYVEDTSRRRLSDDDRDRGRNFAPRTILAIADCSYTVELEFELYSPLQRKNSFHKIDTLIAALTAFRAGLVAECAVFREREAILRREPPGASASQRTNR